MKTLFVATCLISIGPISREITSEGGGFGPNSFLTLSAIAVSFPCQTILPES
jgi:hypothetical protein